MACGCSGNRSGARRVSGNELRWTAATGWDEGRPVCVVDDEGNCLSFDTQHQAMEHIRQNRIVGAWAQMVSAPSRVVVD